MKTYYVYILASKKRGTLYIGVTNDLIRRVHEHRTNAIKGFTNKYDIHALVYYEATSSIESAIAREKQLKNWHRPWKINLIEQYNQGWKDLYPDICGQSHATSWMLKQVQHDIIGSVV